MPKYIKLHSLKSVDDQEGVDRIGAKDHTDELRLILLLDGKPLQETIKFELTRGEVHEFGDLENQINNGNPLVYWSNADLTIYEADAYWGTDALVDLDTDEWIQNVRLDDFASTGKTLKISIGKRSNGTTLMPGRSDCEYELTYSIGNYTVKPRVVQGVAAPRPPFREGQARYKRDKGNCRWICAIDGGGGAWHLPAADVTKAGGLLSNEVYRHVRHVCGNQYRIDSSRFACRRQGFGRDHFTLL
jgi:hypothetical protein